jgi:hypothetical protein
VESGDNTPFENRIRFFFRKYCTTVAFHLLFKIGLLIVSNCNPVPPGTGTILGETSFKKRPHFG